MGMEARDRPLFIYDGNCGFCRIWIEYCRELTDSRVNYAPSQEAARDYREIAPEEFTKSVQLILPDGQVLSAAHAVFQILTYAAKNWPMELYTKLPGFRPASEFAYRCIASHRSLFYWLTVLLFGKRVLAGDLSENRVAFSPIVGSGLFGGVPVVRGTASGIDRHKGNTPC